MIKVYYDQDGYKITAVHDRIEDFYTCTSENPDVEDFEADPFDVECWIEDGEWIEEGMKRVKVEVLTQTTTTYQTDIFVVVPEDATDGDVLEQGYLAAEQFDGCEDSREVGADHFIYDVRKA